jgi:hypothetical protein
MVQLQHRHLMTMALDVDFAGMIGIGKLPFGRRRIAPVKGGTFTGDRLRGQVLPGADWVINRPDGVMLIDVRLVLKMQDAALAYLTYQGRFLAPAETMARFGKGAVLEPHEYSLAVVARLECGDERYAWLNDSIIVGTGTQTASGPVYEFFSIGD